MLLKGEIMKSFYSFKKNYLFSLMPKIINQIKVQHPNSFHDAFFIQDLLPPIYSFQFFLKFKLNDFF